MHILKTHYIIPILILLSFSGKEATPTVLFHENQKIPDTQTTPNILQISGQNTITPDTNVHIYDSLHMQTPLLIKQDSLPVFNYQNVKNYIFSNLYYPPEAQEKGITGEVQVHFSILKNGETTHIRIVKSVHPLLDSATLQLIQAMPRWKPFTQKPIPDSLSYTIPVTFELKNDR